MAEWVIEAAFGGLLLCFCLFLLWNGQGEGLLRQGSGRLISAEGASLGLGGHLARLKEITDRQPPGLRARQITARAGETVHLWQRLQVEESGKGWITMEQQEGVTGRILAFYNRQGKRIKPVYWKEDDSWEEIPSSVGCDLAEGSMIFFQSGSYRVAVQLMDSYGRITEALVTFLVEAA